MQARAARMRGPAAALLPALTAALCAVSAAAADTAPSSELPLAPWFKPGEELVYRIYWGILRVGASRVRTDWVQVGGRRLIAIRYVARTNALFDAIYPVDDSSETLVEPDTFLPVRHRCTTGRRGRRYDETIEFDYPAGMARVESKSDNFVRQLPLTPQLRDLVSFLYLQRTRPLRPDEERTCRFLAGTGSVDIHLAARGAESVDLPLYGKVECIRVEPTANFAGYLIEDGRAMAWVSTDPRRLCTRLEIRGTIADVNVVLCQVNGPGDDAWATIPKKSGPPACLRGANLPTNASPDTAAARQPAPRGESIDGWE